MRMKSLHASHFEQRYVSTKGYGNVYFLRHHGRFVSQTGLRLLDHTKRQGDPCHPIVKMAVIETWSDDMMHGIATSM